MLVGVHVSISGSLDKAVDRAKELGCTTFQIFTRNPRGWRARDLLEDEISEFNRKLHLYRYKKPAAHMPYLPNLASPEEESYARSVSILTSELDKCGRLGIPYLITHLGSHLGRGLKFGIDRVVEACNTAIADVKNRSMILLENTAGTKNSVGSSFENIVKIMDQIESVKRIGVCFDTCHAFAAGYDLRTEKDVEKTLKLFDDIVGFSNLKVVHMNDSRGEFNSNSDRHEHIGLGHIGEEGFRVLLQHSVIRVLPLILETPVDDRRDDRGNIQKVLELAGELKAGRRRSS